MAEIIERTGAKNLPFETIGELTPEKFAQVWVQAGDYRYQALLYLTKKNRIEILQSPYALKDTFKAMQGKRWHGYIEGDKRKIWSVANSHRNRFQFEALAGDNPYEWFDRPLIEHDYPKYGSEGFGYYDLMSQQVQMADLALTYHYQIWGAEMGCIDGDALVRVNVAGHFISVKLKELYTKFKTDKSIKVMSLCNGLIQTNGITDVLDKGIKDTIKITFCTGEELVLTPEHKVAVAINLSEGIIFKEAKDLERLDVVLSNRHHFVQSPGRVIVDSVEPNTPTHVYDIVCEDPHRNFIANGIVVHNSGKSLAAFAVMEQSQLDNWWWVGPKSSLNGIRQEIDKWGFDKKILSKFMHYELAVKTIREWHNGDPAPNGIILDEIHNLKTPTSQRTQSIQKITNAIRAEHGFKGYAILMTGTPAPKSPGDWWSPCEIAYPGFIKEGSRDTFEKRLGFFRLNDSIKGVTFNKRIDWRDDTAKCLHCGYVLDKGHHILGPSERVEVLDDEGNVSGILLPGDIVQADRGFDAHAWEESVNEVAELHERLDGLAVMIFKKDCMDLPEKLYREVICEPTPSLMRVAAALMKSAKNVISGLTLVRELSDGFQYREIEDGYKECDACEDGQELSYFSPDDPDCTFSDVSQYSPEFVGGLESELIPCSNCNGTQKVVKKKRITREVPCAKEDALVDLLDQNEPQKRVVIFAGFVGALDRVKRVCQREGWDTMRVDGRGWKIERLIGKHDDDGNPEVEIIHLENPLDYWIQNPERRVAFIAHPKSGGVSLTLCPQENRPGAIMVIYYSNDFDPASRSQSEDRIHRAGMDLVKGALIVDLIHLPTDRRVLNVLKANRKLELMTMGDFIDDLEVENDD